MSTAPEELGYTTDDQIAAAREIIRSHGDGEIVGIHSLLDELGVKTSPGMDWMIDLIYRLWADPSIDQVPRPDSSSSRGLMTRSELIELIL